MFFQLQKTIGKRLSTVLCRIITQETFPLASSITLIPTEWNNELDRVVHQSIAVLIVLHPWSMLQVATLRSGIIVKFYLGSKQPTQGLAFLFEAESCGINNKNNNNNNNDNNNNNNNNNSNNDNNNNNNNNDNNNNKILLEIPKNDHAPVKKIKINSRPNHCNARNSKTVCGNYRPLA